MGNTAGLVAWWRDSPASECDTAEFIFYQLFTTALVEASANKARHRAPRYVGSRYPMNTTAPSKGVPYMILGRENIRLSQSGETLKSVKEEL